VLAVAICAVPVAAADNAAGLAAASRGDYAQALTIWKPLAEQGDAVAQYNLGVLYERGQGVGADAVEAMQPSAPVLHDHIRTKGMKGAENQKTNVIERLDLAMGDVEKGFAEADRVFEAEYEVPKVQQAHIEPHVCAGTDDRRDICRIGDSVCITAAEPETVASLLLSRKYRHYFYFARFGINLF